MYHCHYSHQGSCTLRIVFEMVLWEDVTGTPALPIILWMCAGVEDSTFDATGIAECRWLCGLRAVSVDSNVASTIGYLCDNAASTYSLVTNIRFVGDQVRRLYMLRESMRYVRRLEVIRDRRRLRSVLDDS